MLPRAMCLAIVQIALLLYLVGNVLPFTPNAKRYILPKYSNLELKPDRSNIGDGISGDTANESVDEIVGKSNNTNTMTPTVVSTKPSSPLPTNTVMASIGAPLASLNKKIPIPIKSSGGKDEDNGNRQNDRKMDLMWCQSDRCQEVVRERVVGDHNTIVFNGPATGQVAYRWNKKAHPISRSNVGQEIGTSQSKIASVLLLVKRDDDTLLEIAAKKVSCAVVPTR